MPDNIMTQENDDNSSRPAADSAEAELIRRAKKGDNGAVEEIFKKHRQKIFSVAFRYLHDHDDASDATQDTFVNAFKFFYKFNEKSELATWLVRICLNLCWHRRRAAKIKGFFEVPLDKNIETPEEDIAPQRADGLPAPHEEVEKKQERELVRAAVDSLKKKYREIIILNELEGYSYRECSKILGISQGTVMSRLHRARALLYKKCLGKF